MPEEPTPPAALSSGLTDQCRSLSADQLRELATYAEALAKYRERESRSDGEEQSTNEPTKDKPDGVPSGASITIKEINDNRYRYWQWRDGEKIKSKYIGPANADE